MGILQHIGRAFLALTALGACAPEQPPLPLSLPEGYTQILSTDQAPTRLVETVANRLEQGCWFGGPLSFTSKSDVIAERDYRTLFVFERPGAPTLTEILVLGRVKLPSSKPTPQTIGVAEGELDAAPLPPPVAITPWTTFIGLKPAIAPAVADILRTDIIATHYGFERCTTLTTGIG